MITPHRIIDREHGQGFRKVSLWCDINMEPRREDERQKSAFATSGPWCVSLIAESTGKERYMGLGSANVVTLAVAREKAKEAREQVAAGIDPVEAKKAQKAIVTAAVAPITTFEQYATTWIAAHEGGWKNPVHRAQWSQTMRDYAYPYIGKMAIDAVGTEDVLACLRPIWAEIPETARRGRIEKILSAAKSEGLRTGENPALWHDHLVNVLPKKPKGGHHAALSYELAPAFWKSLRSEHPQASPAIRPFQPPSVRSAERSPRA